MLDRMRKTVCVIILGGVLFMSGCVRIPQEQPEKPLIEDVAIDKQIINPAMDRGDTLIIATPVAKGFFHPYLASQITDKSVIDAVFDGLLAFNDKGMLTPAIAEAFEIDELGMSVTLTLRQDIAFHDGEPLTVDDVLFSYDLMSTLGMLDNLTQWEAVGAWQLVFVFDKPSYSQLTLLTLPIIPKHYYEPFFIAYDDSEVDLPPPMGSGPLIYDSYEAGQGLSFYINRTDVKNTTSFERVTFAFMTSEGAREALALGDVDVIKIPANQPNFVSLSTVPYVRFIHAYTSDIATIGMVHEGILENVKVRQALAYALNRERFVEAQWFRELETPYSVFSSRHYLFPRDQAFNDYAYDLEKAKRLLEEAGLDFSEEVSLTLTAFNDVSWSYNLAIHAQEQWSKLGFRVSIEWLDFAQLTQKLLEGDPPQLWTMAWHIPALFHPDAFFGSGEVTPSYNIGQFRDSNLDDIMEKIRVLPQADLKALTSEWTLVVNDQLPMIMVAHIGELWGVNHRVVGFQVSPYVPWVKHVGTLQRYSEGDQ